MSINTGMPSRSLNHPAMGTFSHLGKLGENREMPFSISKSPGTPIPMHSTSSVTAPAFDKSSLILFSIRSRTPSEPSWTMVGVLCSATAKKSFANRDVLIFVPPRSIPILYFFIICPFRQSPRINHGFCLTAEGSPKRDFRQRQICFYKSSTSALLFA